MNLGEQLDYFEAQLEHCMLCPRECGVNRLEGEIGFCKAGAGARVASRCLHRGEEPPISGSRGSGTIFFSNCNMRCVYCQNYPISQMGYGNDLDIEDLTAMMLDLEKRGAHNINLVTATHYLPQAVKAIVRARSSGLRIPVVSNTSGYESTETLSMLEGLVQVYLVDMRYSRGESSARYSEAPDYPGRNRAAVRHMVEMAGPLACRAGLASGGVIIRHLLLPGMLHETREILGFIARELTVRLPVSIMTQYFPANRAGLYPEIDRKITSAEYEEALSILESFGIEEGWIQDPLTCARPVA